MIMFMTKNLLALLSATNLVPSFNDHPVEAVIFVLSMIALDRCLAYRERKLKEKTKP